MSQKSDFSRVMANPPSRTTVAQMKPSVPRQVATFSMIARRRANSVSFCSGGDDDRWNAIAEEAGVASAVSPLFPFSTLFLKSNTVSLEPRASSSLWSSNTCLFTDFRF